MTFRAAYLAWVIGMTLGPGCNGGSGGDEGTGATGGAESTGEATSTGTGAETGPGTTGEPTTGTTVGTSSGPSGGTTEATGTGGTTGGSEYCMGFDVDAPAPFLEVDVQGGDPWTDGVVWPLECGGQGLWMFALYPRFGGWDPMQQYVLLDITVDVEGYNTNPDGHFFSAEMGSYYIGCEFPDGGIVGLIPVFPLDTVADLSVLDGLKATVHLEIDTGAAPLVFDGSATLQVSKMQLEIGCGFG
jgi:hypothetical protein